MGFTTETQRIKRIVKQGKTLETLCVLRVRLRRTVVKIFIFLVYINLVIKLNIKRNKSIFYANINYKL